MNIATQQQIKTLTNTVSALVQEVEALKARVAELEQPKEKKSLFSHTLSLGKKNG